MPTPKELRQALVEARADLHAALHEAHAAWENKPASGEGEDAWSPMQVAQHVIGADRFFTSQIAQACGAPAMDRPQIDAGTPAAAAAAFVRVAAQDDDILRHVSQDDLARTFEGRLGVLSVEQLLVAFTDHVKNHAQQIRAAC